MPRARSPKRDEAYRIWLSSGKEKTLKEIAAELGVSETQVRKWKNQDKWNSNVTNPNGNVTNPKSNVTNQKKIPCSAEKDAVAEEVQQVTENSGLTDKQRLFCISYIRCFNATKAYQKAYGVSYDTAMAAGSQLLRNIKVREQIQRLKQNRLTREINVVRFRDSDEVDGTLISEVKQGRDGASIKLADRMKALDWISSHMSLATEEQKAKIEHLRANTEKLKSDSSSDGIEAIKAYVESVTKSRGQQDGG